MKKEACPTYFGVRLPAIGANGDIQRFAPTGALTAAEFESFGKDLIGNKLLRHKKSAPTPEDPFEDHVRVITGNTFDEGKVLLHCI